jgi:hypothetical protein
MRIPVCVLRNHKPHPPALATDRPAAFLPALIVKLRGTVGFLTGYHRRNRVDGLLQSIPNRTPASDLCILEIGRVIMVAVAKNEITAAISRGPLVSEVESGSVMKYRRHKIAVIAMPTDETKSPVNETTAMTVT